MNKYRYRVVHHDNPYACVIKSTRKRQLTLALGGLKVHSYYAALICLATLHPPAQKLQCYCIAVLHEIHFNLKGDPAVTCGRELSIYR